MDPASLMALATIISQGGQAAGAAYGAKKTKKSASRKAKELKRQTLASLLNEQAQRGTEEEAEMYGSRARLGQRRSTALLNTAASLRDAFGI